MERAGQPADWGRALVSEPAKLKAVRAAAESMGFLIAVDDTFEYDKPATLYKTTEKGHNAGDVLYPAKHLVAHRLVAHHPTQRLAFEVVYADGFDYARVLDPAGEPVELRSDYTYTDDYAKTVGYSPLHAAMLTQRRDAEYNDGETFVRHQWEYDAANKFYAWVDEWLDITHSEAKRLAPKKKEPVEEKPVDLMDVDEFWEAS